MIFTPDIRIGYECSVWSSGGSMGVDRMLQSIEEERHRDGFRSSFLSISELEPVTRTTNANLLDSNSSRF